MRSVRYPAVLLIILLFITSCGKIEKLPPEPSIKFQSFEVFDSITFLGSMKAGRLNFYFEDGDGDLGLPAPELRSGLDSTNLFFTLFRRKGGVLDSAEINDPLKPSPYRIPYMEREGQNKILRGNICVTFLYLFYSATDTIKYDFFVKDRADHISNTASTCEIVLKSNGICNK
jgi:hypothetical protein